MNPTHLDLFSGIGGFSLAAERCGFKTIGFSEINPYANQVLKKRWPNIPNYGDIRNVTKESVGYTDIITAGFPCQPFSLSGQRRGDSDERHLWPELRNVFGRLRPQFGLLENVPGILSINAGRIFGDVLHDLAEIGYDALWNCVPASAVGANHQRDRVWIVAHTTNPGIEALCERKNEAILSNPNISQCEGGSLSIRIHQEYPYLGQHCGWEAEPRLDRVANGIANRSHRLKCIGNSIVPQVAEIFLKEIRKLIQSTP